jgi:hypothetical protein
MEVRCDNPENEEMHDSLLGTVLSAEQLTLFPVGS